MDVVRKDGLLLVRELAAEVKNHMDFKINAVMVSPSHTYLLLWIASCRPMSICIFLRLIIFSRYYNKQIQKSYILKYNIRSTSEK